jgi:multiple sugar transport system ATP-binding protein
MARVKLTKLTKRFKDVTAVDSLDLVIRDKEFLVLVGPSGCGKTTALRMIAGLEEITEGTIEIGDRVVNDLFPKDRDIAMVFQNYALYPHMSVYENLAFSLRMRGLPSIPPLPAWLRHPLGRLLSPLYTGRLEKAIREEVLAAARKLGLDELLHRKPKELSGGQRQRVALGRAIVRKPRVFLMDEPLSNLDAKLRVQTRAELIKLHRELGVTTIYVTHDQVEAMTMGQRIAVMNQGLLQQCNTPLHLYRYPANLFVAGFLGSPAMNFMKGTIHISDGQAWVETSGLRLRFPESRLPHLQPYDGQTVTFGVRPEDIHDRALNHVPGADGTAATLQVEVIEPMGDRSVLYTRAGEDTLIATVTSETKAREFTPLDVTVEMEKTHVFDLDTGRAVFPGPSGEQSEDAPEGTDENAT